MMKPVNKGYADRIKAKVDKEPPKEYVRPKRFVSKGVDSRFVSCTPRPALGLTFSDIECVRKF